MGLQAARRIPLSLPCQSLAVVVLVFRRGVWHRSSICYVPYRVGASHSRQLLYFAEGPSVPEATLATNLAPYLGTWTFEVYQREVRHGFGKLLG